MTDGTRIGVVGQLAPAIAEAHGLPSSDAVYVAEIDLDAADQAAPEGRSRASSRCPATRRSRATFQS